jgi:hypothetical protein
VIFEWKSKVDELRVTYTDLYADHEVLKERYQKQIEETKTITAEF